MYVDQVKYLSILLLSARVFKCSFDQLKMKFYQCFNAIYHKACNADNELVCVQLMKSVCLPVLLYSLEVLFPSKTAINMLNNVADRAFYRIFKCTDNSDIKLIRSMFDLLDVNVIRLQTYIVSQTFHQLQSLV